jgi:pimeloyl-ACP methyl ester carboxylesterase
MPKAPIGDIELYYEEAGSGYPLIFCHEFAGDLRSWEPQVRYFSRRYRVITYNARGYPPSDVPNDVSAYSQMRAVEDIVGLMQHLQLSHAHMVGLSMGGYAVLHLGLHYPNLVRSLVIAGCGYGSGSEERAKFQQDVEQTAQRIERNGMPDMAAMYSRGPTRVQFSDKDPRGLGHDLSGRTGATAIGVRAGSPNAAVKRTDTDYHRR